LHCYRTSAKLIVPNSPQKLTAGEKTAKIQSVVAVGSTFVLVYIDREFEFYQF